MTADNIELIEKNTKNKNSIIPAMLKCNICEGIIFSQKV